MSLFVVHVLESPCPPSGPGGRFFNLNPFSGTKTCEVPVGEFFLTRAVSCVSLKKNENKPRAVSLSLSQACLFVKETDNS